MNITIKPDESVTIIGRKGTGKTKILLYLLGLIKPIGVHRIVILDTKQVGDFKGFPSVTELRHLHKAVERNAIVVYAPNKYEMREPSYIEGFFEWCYERWNVTVVVDELTSIVWGNDVPDSYKDITDRGRAKHVSIWQGNQKPVFVPHAALSEADHFFVLDLNMKPDREKMAGIIGDEAKVRPPDKHGFWYYHQSLRSPVYCPGIQIP